MLLRLLSDWHSQPGSRRASGWIALLVALAVLPANGADRYLGLADFARVTTGWGAAHDAASVDGKPLRIGRVQFSHGIGTHAPFELARPVVATERWLTFYEGISSAMTERGSATVEVWLDDRKVHDSGTMRVRGEPRYVAIPLSGARELRIVGTDAGDGMAADHVNLGLLRLSDAATEPKPDSPHSLEFAGDAAAPSSPLTLWYRRPALRWLESLPLGNGRLGAMQFGGVMTERIALNESTFWSGAASTNHDNPGGAVHLGEIRSRLFAGDFAGASKLMQEHLLGRQDTYGTHLPVGDLLIRPGHPQDNVRNYRRELSLDDGVARVEYSLGNVRYTREVYASHPDNVVVVRLAADRRGAVSFETSFQGNQPGARVSAGAPDTLRIATDARERKHSDGKTGVSLVGFIRALPEGGTVRVRDDRLVADGCDAVTLLIALNTTFRGGDPEDAGRRQIAEASTVPPLELKRRHQVDHQALFRRVSLDLGDGGRRAMPTDERLDGLRRGGADADLAALFFQYGRYLLIAGSREDSPLPTNLQGIWNDNVACNMGWTCDFHLDINTQQNYWPAEVGNLAECHEPLFRLVESLREPGRRTARVVYGARGWVCHVFTNPWGFTAPGWSLGWGLHPTGGIWIASDLWEHYRFTRDREFLRTRAYPVLKEAAMFFLDSMVVDPKSGWLVTGPSTSPENAFRAPDGKGVFSEYMGPTCDIVLVRDLFASCVEASEILGVDAEFRSGLQEAMAKLPPLRVGRHGQLMEWLEDFEEAMPNHRHTTHLIALHPSSQITPRRTPQLAQAARVTLARRLGQKDWEDVEWSRGNLVNFYARLGEGDTAHHHLLGLLTSDTEADLLTFSRGGIAGAEENVFCVDGNSAGTAGIAEMLLQSHDDAIELLPALPKAWPAGRVTGLKARGNVTVDIEWRDGRVTASRFRSREPRPVTVRVRGESRTVIPDRP